MTRSRSFVFSCCSCSWSGWSRPRTPSRTSRSSATRPSGPSRRVLFNAEFQAGSNITSVVLEYGVNQLTCGTVEAKAFPPLTPGRDVKVNWAGGCASQDPCRPVQPFGGTGRWLIRRDAVPPAPPKPSCGWIISTLAGHPGRKNQPALLQWRSFLWATIARCRRTGPAALSQDVGVGTDSPVDVYIYANSEILQSSILYAPAWSVDRLFQRATSSSSASRLTSWTGVRPPKPRPS